MLRIRDLNQPRKEVQQPLILSLIVALIFFAASAAIFGKIASEVMEGETQKIDEALLLVINGASNTLLDKTIIFLTTFGGVAFTLLVASITIIYFWRKREWRAAVFVTFAVGGTLIANSLLKLLFQRDRPTLWDLLVTESTYSFPSGHAALSCTLAITAIILLWHSTRRRLVIIAALIYVAIIGFTRLYLGVHYPTDVLAGWLVASGWVLTVGVIMGIIYISSWRKLTWLK